jgi:hypothetical protein
MSSIAMGEPSETESEGGGGGGGEDEIGDPDALVCPISLSLMADPVFTADGHTCVAAFSCALWKARSGRPSLLAEHLHCIWHL